MKPQTTERPVRVGLISLGCAKNLVDAEVMVGTLLRDGVEITNDAAQADVVIVNTCSFIDSAQEESVDTILESEEVRNASNRGQGLIVSGCLPQRFRDELPKLLPEVDAFIGIDQVTRITDIVKEALARRSERLKASRKPSDKKGRAEVVERLARLEAGQATSPSAKGEPLRSTEKSGQTKTVVTPGTHHASRITTHHPPPPAPLIEVSLRPRYIPDYATPRFRLTPRHFAYVKIAEGCNHPCSFCIIPRMRGSHRSRQQADIVAEARALIADGVRELNLISQDSTYYGLDLRPNRSQAISAPGRFSAAVKSLPAETPTICTLLRELNALPGNFWIRLLY
ncbi:MAG: radical SAM protein, partial [Verrucomicrobia bacterium]|nr:radical SAM protein [Verrucomicrobiota bacterium]